MDWFLAVTGQRSWIRFAKISKSQKFRINILFNEKIFKNLNNVCSLLRFKTLRIFWRKKIVTFGKEPPSSPKLANRFLSQKKSIVLKRTIEQSIFRFLKTSLSSTGPINACISNFILIKSGYFNFTKGSKIPTRNVLAISTASRFNFMNNLLPYRKRKYHTK